MRKLLPILALSLAAAAAFAAEPSPRIPSLQQEVAAALEEYSPREVGALTVGDLEAIAAKVSLASRKASFVPRSAMMSMVMPGMGQFVNGDRAAGVLFAAGNVAIMAGTIVATWLLLPVNVQPQSLFVVPVGDIKGLVESHTLLEYLPSIGAMAGGMLLDDVLRLVSAGHAAGLARKNIAEGKITFEPEAGFMGHGFMMGMRVRAKR
ncbi:MAG: hypothetical protein NT005_07520 [Spirochaetes bacterium]|nr:hypothetical protein [Spirochaetota bacterium]